jgi:hypothetical protein
MHRYDENLSILCIQFLIIHSAKNTILAKVML